MDCIIRVISGPDTGENARLQAGTNLIGRSPKAALRLKAPDISWEHCTITRSGDDYVAENLSALGTYLDDAKLSGPLRLRPRDELRLSRETVIRLEALGSTGGLLAGRRGIILTLVVLLVGAAGLFAWKALSEPKLTDNWPKAYSELEPWVAQETQHKRLPADTAALFHDAWRLEQSEAYARSSAMWLRLQLSLDSVEESRGFLKAAADNPSALRQLLASAGNIEERQALDDQQMAAAFAQFVKRRLDWSSRLAKKK